VYNEAGWKLDISKPFAVRREDAPALRARWSLKGCGTRQASAWMKLTDPQLAD
jgi:hypothetical protein